MNTRRSSVSLLVSVLGVALPGCADSADDPSSAESSVTAAASSVAMTCTIDSVNEEKAGYYDKMTEVRSSGCELDGPDTALPSLFLDDPRIYSRAYASLTDAHGLELIAAYAEHARASKTVSYSFKTVSRRDAYHDFNVWEIETARFVDASGNVTTLTRDDLRFNTNWFTPSP